MTRDERTLHDYLDGRLTPDERSSFEQRMRDDPRLAERVAGCRALGDALRAGAEPPLDDTFYAVARRRYARGESGAARRRHFSLFSWESAGLAAAAVLALALFIPPLITRETRVEPEPAAAGRAEASADVELPEEVDTDAARGTAGDLQPRKESEPRTQSREDELTAAKNESQATAGTTRDEPRFAPSPAAPDEPRSRQSPPPVAARRQVVSKVMADRLGAAEAEADRPVALTHIVIPRRTLRIVAGVDGEALGPPRAGTRIVLVGGVASPQACGRIAIVRHPRAWTISAEFVEPGAHGTTCAVRLPDDGNPVGIGE